jgi:DNA-directed RNA polymerase specialized sigma24 family protein
MSELSKKVNRFFENATKAEVENLLDNIIITDHEKQVFRLKYIKGHDIDYIAIMTGYSKGKIEADLRKIRRKMEKLV